MTLLRTKRPIITEPNDNYRYNFQLTNIRIESDYIIGDPPHERFFMPNLRENKYPKGVLYPKYAWEKVG